MRTSSFSLAGLVTSPLAFHGRVFGSGPPGPRDGGGMQFAAPLPLPVRRSGVGSGSRRRLDVFFAHVYRLPNSRASDMLNWPILENFEF